MGTLRQKQAGMQPCCHADTLEASTEDAWNSRANGSRSEPPLRLLGLYTTRSDPFPRTVGVGQSHVCAGTGDRPSSDHQGLLSWAVSPAALPAS